jgi:hypothetical protein
LNVLAIEQGEQRPGHVWKGGPNGIGLNWMTARQTTADVMGFAWRNTSDVGVGNGPGGARTIDTHYERISNQHATVHTYLYLVVPPPRSGL